MTTTADEYARLGALLRVRPAAQSTQSAERMPNSTIANENNDLTPETDPQSQEFKSTRLHGTLPEFTRHGRRDELPSRRELIDRLMGYHWQLMGAYNEAGTETHSKLVVKLWNDAVREAAWAAKHHRNPEELLIK